MYEGILRYYMVHIIFEMNFCRYPSYFLNLVTEFGAETEAFNLIHNYPDYETSNYIIKIFLLF